MKFMLMETMTLGGKWDCQYMSVFEGENEQRFEVGQKFDADGKEYF